MTNPCYRCKGDEAIHVYYTYNLDNIKSEEKIFYLCEECNFLFNHQLDTGKTINFNEK